MRTSRWLPIVLVPACLLLGADQAPPAADAPRSAEAKQAMQAYEKATLDARKVRRRGRKGSEKVCR